jgi:[NiFe] hydrogenase assembly HybE family chaperone
VSTTVDPRPNPAAELQRCYEDLLQTRMAGLPVLSPALRVETIGFTPWQDGWLGVIITPWFMGLLWVPVAHGVSLGTEGEPVTRSLPLMDVEFHVCHADGVGDYLACSLFSPMAAFTDQDVARATAETVLAAVLEAPSLAEPAAPPASHTLSFDRQVSRRDWLKLFTGGD